jgi:hypothetical protein
MIIKSQTEMNISSWRFHLATKKQIIQMKPISVLILAFLMLNFSEPVKVIKRGKASKGRTTISLNGTWEIDESVSATDIPKLFTHSVVVPGLVYW